MLRQRRYWTAAICLAAASLCSQSFAASDGRGVSVEEAISLLEARERTIQSLDVVYSSSGFTDPQWPLYQASLELNQREQAKFLNVDRKPRDVPKKTARHKKPEREFFRIRWKSNGVQRLEQFRDWKADTKPDVFSQLYFNGRVWQGYWPTSDRGPSVSIDSNPGVLPALQIFGLANSKLASEYLLLDNIAPAESVVLYSRFIAWASAEGYLYEAPTFENDTVLGRVLRITVLMPKHSGSHPKIELLFSAARGFAPVRIAGNQIVIESGKASPALMSSHYVGSWDGFFEPLPRAVDCKEFCIGPMGRCLSPAVRQRLRAPQEGRQARPSKIWLQDD